MQGTLGRWTSILSLFLVAGAPRNADSQSFNPEGLIIDKGWLVLGPFAQPFACGSIMSGNDSGDLLTLHLAPSSVHNLAPVEGQEVDYDPDRASTLGYFGPPGPQGNPVWRTLLDQGGDGDLDFQADADLVGAPGDFIVTFAATYFLFTGVDPVEVEMCIGSDDAVQVWLDTELVHNYSACRGRLACQDVVSVTIQPGAHRIVLGVWESQGGFGGSLGFRVNDLPIVNGADVRGIWVFLGPEKPEGFTLPTEIYVRSVTGLEGANRCPPAVASLEVKIQAELPPGPSVTIEESILGNVLKDHFTASDGGIVRERILEPELDPLGIFDDSLTLVTRPICAGGNGEASFQDGGTPADPTDDSYTLANIGEGIWATGDAFTFAYTKVEGDFILTARIKDRRAAPGAIDGHFGGIQARQDLTRRSRYTMVADAEAQATHFEGRHTHGGYDDWLMGSAPEGGHPPFVRIARSGNTLTGHTSDDGMEFSEIGRMIWTRAPPAILVGLVASSHTFDCKAGPAAVTYDRVSLELLPGARKVPLEPSVPVGVDITWRDVPRDLLARGLRYSIDSREVFLSLQGIAGSVPIFGPGSALMLAPVDFGPFADPEFTHAHAIGKECGETHVSSPGPGKLAITSSGPDIFVSGDGFTFAYKEVSGDFSTQVTITEREFLSGTRFAVHGMMARQDCGIRSRYSAVLDVALHPEDGTRFSFRPTHGWSDNKEVIPGVEHANTLRLDRCGNEFIGYVLSEPSDPGDPTKGTFGGKPGEWVMIGSHFWGAQAPETVLVGLAVTAGTTCRSATVTFAEWQLSTSCPGTPSPHFVRGDSNSDGTVNITDAVHTLLFLFTGGPIPFCLDAADSDDSGGLVPDLTDAVVVLSWLFRGGAPLPAPGPSTGDYDSGDCGPDPTRDDGMDCAAPSEDCIR